MSLVVVTFSKIIVDVTLTSDVLMDGLIRFRTKYHPDEYVSRQQEARQTLKHRCRVFMKLLELGWLSDVAIDNDHTDELVHILDAGV